MNIENLRYWLLGNYTGLIGTKKLIAEIDSLINKGEWIDEFEKLMSEKYYSNGEVYTLFEKGELKLEMEHFKIFENLYYSKLRVKQRIKQLNSEEILESLYRYLKFKITSLHLTSNDVTENWNSLINEYELIKGGYGNHKNLPNLIIEFFDKEEESIITDDFFGLILNESF